MAAHVINAVRSFLASNHMFVEDEWLTGCVDYLTENSGGNLSLTEVQNLAKEQWLLNDLNDICPGCLPPNLASQTKTVLNGRYMLQINATIDIGTSAYQQYLKLQKVNMDNVETTTRHEDKVPNHGEQELTAIEYKPMRNSSCDISPGAKILIKGPVNCRRGIILLTESSIELMGGDVADIAISNSLPALLATKLGLPMPQEADANTTISHARNTDIPAPHTDVPTWSSNQMSETNMIQTTAVPNITDIDDDIDIDQINALEALLNPSNSVPSSSNERPKSNNPDTGVYIELDPVKRPSPSDYNIPEKKFKEDTVNKDDYPDDMDLIIEEDEDLLREIDAKIDVIENHEPMYTGPKVVSSEPFVYIKHINELSESKRHGVFKVKAQIMKLLSKLTVGKDAWCLKCTIVDGTGSLDVEFTSAVLSKLVGYTPQEMTQLKKDMAKDPQLKETVILALKNAKEALQVLYCIIEITIQDVPRITNLIPFADVHVDLLRKRI
ncbi:hypothetical protein O3G_MSEX013513 [Manduca sexta]|uniref:RecQ-mediated genome instability protein 1 n=2 Tax=Manduca sexta TaxID=7130 RepID=A0A922CY41_MANSE|nr:hypothetical protein O3G_MSEX013513 [Manduca sexta]